MIGAFSESRGVKSGRLQSGRRQIGRQEELNREPMPEDRQRAEEMREIIRKNAAEDQPLQRRVFSTGAPPLQPRVFSETPPQQQMPVQQQAPAVGSLTGGVRVSQNIPVPQARQEPESKWAKAWRTFQQVADTDLYNQAIDFLAGFGKGGSWQEGLQMGVEAMRKGESERGKQNKTLNLLQDMGFTAAQAKGLAASPDLIKPFLDYSIKQKELAQKGIPSEIDLKSGIINTIDENGVPVQVPIKYSQGYRDIQKQIKQGHITITAFKNQQRSVEETIAKMVEMIRKHGRLVTGSQAAANPILGSVGDQFRAYQTALQGMVSITTLKEVKQSSPTGGAFGQTSEKEFTALGSSAGALNQTLDPDKYVESLQNILQKSKLAFNTQYQEERDFINQSEKILTLSDRYVRGGSTAKREGKSRASNNSGIIGQEVIDGKITFLLDPNVQGAQQNVPKGAQFIFWNDNQLRERK